MNSSLAAPSFRFEIVENNIPVGKAFAYQKPVIRCDADADVRSHPNFLWENMLSRRQTRRWTRTGSSSGK